MRADGGHGFVGQILSSYYNIIMMLYYDLRSDTMTYYSVCTP